MVCEVLPPRGLPKEHGAAQAQPNGSGKFVQAAEICTASSIVHRLVGIIGTQDDDDESREIQAGLGRVAFVRILLCTIPHRAESGSSDGDVQSRRGADY